ncbi:MAG: hypothetical protein MR832_08980, partial [Clostridiales bacterium]|nr:hypothetical protein [Clostridiales bacterium]
RAPLFEPKVRRAGTEICRRMRLPGIAAHFPHKKGRKPLTRDKNCGMLIKPHLSQAEFAHARKRAKAGFRVKSRRIRRRAPDGASPRRMFAAL